MGVGSCRHFLRVALLALLLASTCLLGRTAASDLEGFDVEDDLPAPPTNRPGETKEVTYENAGSSEKASGFKEEVDEEAAAARVARETAARKPPGPMPILDKDLWMIETMLICALVAYLINFIIGSGQNSKLVKAWGEAFTQPDGIFDLNFSMLGPGNTWNYFIKDSMATHKFYASGRRYCRHMMATLAMVNRHDIISLIWRLIEPCEDQIIIEVAMHEASMPLMTLAVATRKAMAAMTREGWDGSIPCTDVVKFTNRINIDKGLLPNWPKEKLIVQAEQAAHFYDLFADPRVNQLFNPNSGHGPNVLKYFRGMHISSDADGDWKNLIRFTFQMPSAKNMAELNKCMELSLLFIDLIANYKPSPEMRKKSTDLRASLVSAADEKKRERLEALAKRKEDKLKEEKARVARMSPMDRERYESAQTKKQLKKMTKKA